MAFVPADERMELASSPYHQEDNIDMEFGEDDDTYLTDPHLDSMFEDPPPEDDILLEDEPLGNISEKGDDPMQDELVLNDEDPETNQNPYHEQLSPREDAHEHLEEDDILYEEDENEETAINTAAAATSHPSGPTTAEQPESHQPNTQAVEEQDDLLDDGTDGDPDEEHLDDPEDNIEQEQKALEDQDTTTSGLHVENTTSPTGTLDQNQHVASEHDELTANVPDDNHDPHPGPNQLSGHQEAAGLANTNEIPNIHPVKVHYQESEICMFPPNADDTSNTFFLSDNSLALEPLDKLLAACREVLADSIGEHDELVLDVASLGLHICEVSGLLSIYRKPYANPDAGFQVCDSSYVSTNSRCLPCAFTQRQH